MRRWIPDRRARSALAVVFGASVVAGCAGGCTGGSGTDRTARTVGAYCDAVTANLAALMNPAVNSTDGIESVIDQYRSIAEVAPAAVEPEWLEVIQAFETAATVIAGDPTSLEIANQAALAGQPAYGRLQVYTQQTCGVSIGSPPTPTNPVTATTVVPPSTLGG